MPMRFPVSVLNAATPGLSRGAAALAGGDQAYDYGYDKGVIGQSKVAQMLSSIRANDAAAQAHLADAALKGGEAQIQGDRPSRIADAIADSTGLTRPDVDAYYQYRATGQVPMRDQTIGPPTEEGLGPQPIPKIMPEAMTKIGKAAAQLLPFLTNKGDVGFDSYAKGMGEFRDQGNSDKVIAESLWHQTGTEPRCQGTGANSASEPQSVSKPLRVPKAHSRSIVQGEAPSRRSRCGRRRASSSSQVFHHARQQSTHSACWASFNSTWLTAMPRYGFGDDAWPVARAWVPWRAARRTESSSGPALDLTIECGPMANSYEQRRRHLFQGTALATLTVARRYRFSIVPRPARRAALLNRPHASRLEAAPSRRVRAAATVLAGQRADRLKQLSPAG